jgi:hypothetical protein
MRLLACGASFCQHWTRLAEAELETFARSAVQMLRQSDAKVSKKYPRMKLHMRGGVLEKIKIPG